jgi:hypothetical protein
MVKGGRQIVGKPALSLLKRLSLVMHEKRGFGNFSSNSELPAGCIGMLPLSATLWVFHTFGEGVEGFRR